MRRQKVWASILLVSFILVGTGISLSVSNASTSDSSIKVNLSDGYTLIVDSEEQLVTIALYQFGELTKAVQIAGVALDHEQCQFVRFVHEKEPAYFVRVSYQGSTYGATESVIIWKDGIWWDIQTTPFRNAVVSGPDNDGMYIILEYDLIEKRDIHYSFLKGLFYRIDPTDLAP